MINSVKFTFLLSALIAASLFGQFSSLSTTDDGGVLYFTTPLVRTGWFVAILFDRWL